LAELALGCLLFELFSFVILWLTFVAEREALSLLLPFLAVPTDWELAANIADFRNAGSVMTVFSFPSPCLFSRNL